MNFDTGASFGAMAVTPDGHWMKDDSWLWSFPKYLLGGGEGANLATTLQ